MKAYKVELLIVDHDGLGAFNIRDAIENVNYPNDCVCPKVMTITDADIGEWTDEHPLNHRDKMVAEYKRLFGYMK